MELVLERFGRFGLDELGDVSGELLEMGDAEGESHALGGAEGIDQQRDLLADDIFKQQGGTAALHHPVGDLGDLQFRLDRMCYALELAGLLQNLNEIL